MRIGLRFFVAVCTAGIVAASQPSGADGNKEYLIKAAFIYNFVKFVEWPDGKAIARQSSIDICVLGDGSLESAGAVFKAASTAKLTLSLVQEASVKKVPSHCHIVFISQSENSRFSEIMAALRGQPVLTVSDIGNFAESGGMIGFVTDDNKVKVEVNAKAITSAGLRVDAQLLEIAVKVIDK